MVDTRDLNDRALRGETPEVAPVKVGERPGSLIRANAGAGHAHLRTDAHSCIAEFWIDIRDDSGCVARRRAMSCACDPNPPSSEARRVGHEWVRQGRSRG